MSESGVDSLIVKQGSFQFPDGGASPTSTLQLQLRLIPSRLALNIYQRWHYLGSIGFISSINFGVLYDHHYVGAISYGPPNATDLSPYWTRSSQAGWWEIKRLALSPQCPRNSESRVIGVTIKLLRKMEAVKGIVTYADSAQGHTGTIYKASGFASLGLTDEKKDFIVHGQIQQRGETKGKDGVWQVRSRKWLFVKEFTPKLAALRA
jgi:hypothetical protein